MSHMFNYCSFLPSINLSNFKIINVTNMQRMISSCSFLISFNLSNLNTINASDKNNIFSNMNKSCKIKAKEQKLFDY